MALFHRALLGVFSVAGLDRVNTKYRIVWVVKFYSSLIALVVQYLDEEAAMDFIELWLKTEDVISI